MSWVTNNNGRCINWPAIAATTAPAIGGIFSGFITRKNIQPWYESLKRPSWTPPNWAFGPAWTTIYCSAGYASYMVFRDASAGATGAFPQRAILPLSIYATNMILNFAWTPLFFGAHEIKLALYDVAFLWGTTVAMGVTFYRVNPVAGFLIAPYIVWNTLAVALNYVIYRDNVLQDENGKPKEE